MRLAAVTGLILAAPAIAGAAAAAEGHPRFGPTLFALALLVGAAKAGGLAAERFRQPAVLDELIVGISVSALAHVFVGAALSATSVGITARVLKDLGVTQTREAQIILGAAVLDDILGLIVLAVVTAIATAGAAGLALWTVAGILEGPRLADSSSPSRFPPTRLIRRQDVRRPTACRGASPPQAPYHRRPVPSTPPSHLSFPAPPTRRPRLAGMLPIFREARREPR